MEMTKQNLKAFRKDFNKAVEGLANQYGLVLSIGGITFSPDGFTTRLSAENIGQLAEGETQEEAQFKLNAIKFGFSESDYRRNLELGGATYKLVGFKPTARKNTCIIENAQGTQYVTDERTVRGCFI